MTLLAQILANGVLLGGLYAVMALGLALVWGVLNIVNLAHGSFIMLGAYCSWHLFHYLHLDPFLGLPVTAAVMFAFGYAVQRGLLNLIVRSPMFNTLLLTFGLDVVLTYLAQLAFSADFRAINPAYAGGLYGTISQINPYIGAALTLKSFAIAIIGGLDNPLGVLVGGLFLGIVEALTTLYVGPTFVDVASFGILALVLIVRPKGLLGRTA